MRALTLLPLVFAATLFGGCKSTRDSFINKATDSPEFQKNLLAKTSSACVEAADKKLPDRTAATDTLITNYCDCVGKQTGTVLTHAELAEMGLKGGAMTPDIQAKMDTIVATCQSQAGIK